MRLSFSTKILCFSLICFSLIGVPTVVGYFDFDPNVTLKVKDVVDLIKYYAKLMGVIKTEKKASTNEILAELKVVHASIDRIEFLLRSQPAEIINALSLMQDMKTIEDRYIRCSSYINYQYEKLTFGLDAEDAVPLEDVTLYEFAQESTGHGVDNLPHYVQQFVQLIVPDGGSKTGLLHLYSEYVAAKLKNGEWCDNTQSLNEFIYQTYKYVLEVVTKGYIVILTSYSIRKTFNEGNFQTETEFAIKEYNAAINKIADGLHSLIADASLSLRRCDPKEHERGKTYLEFTRVGQGFLSNKYTLNEDHIGYYDCEHYKSTTYYEYQGLNSDGDWRCNGFIYDCFSSYATHFCETKNPSRRFDGFLAKRTTLSDQNGVVVKNMGNTTSCENHNGHDLFNWIGTQGWTTYNTALCACYCDDIGRPDSLRKISSATVLSDYENNMVVTGVRFVNDNNTIHLEIQQGKLEKYGYINESTVHWKDRKSYATEDQLKNNVIKLSWKSRSINLNAVKAGPHQAIIGVAVAESNAGFVELCAWVANISYASGEILNVKDNIEWDRITPELPTSELTISEPTIPTLAAKNTAVKESNKYIKIQPSDWLKDAAQTIVPFLDIVEVVTNPPTLLSGIGFYYRTSPGYGGFIGLEIMSFNYTEFIFPDPLIDV